PAASSTASLTKFSEAISSRPSCWRRASLSMAAAISGSTSQRGRGKDGVFMGTGHFTSAGGELGRKDQYWQRSRPGIETGTGKVISGKARSASDVCQAQPDYFSLKVAAITESKHTIALYQ